MCAIDYCLSILSDAQSGGMLPARNVISLLLIILLMLQLAVVISPPARFNGGRYWPIVNYAMFSHAHYAGEEIPVSKVRVRLENDQIQDLTGERLGLRRLKFYRFIVEPLITGDATALSRSLLPFEQQQGLRVISIWIENEPLVLTRSGVQPGRSSASAPVHIRGQ